MQGTTHLTDKRQHQQKIRKIQQEKQGRDLGPGSYNLESKSFRQTAMKPSSFFVSGQTRIQSAHNAMKTKVTRNSVQVLNKSVALVRDIIDDDLSDDSSKTPGPGAYFKGIGNSFTGTKI